MRLFQWDRDFGVFFCTQGVSNIGDAAWNVLIPLYVLQLTHNPLQVSAIAIIEAVAFGLLRMPFGALADRLECRRLMIVADLGRTLLTLVIPVATVLHAPTLTVIYIVIVPIEAFSALFDSASGTAIPMLVPADRRGVAYAWQESLESLAWVIGPPLGGLLAVAFGTGKALALDSVTFIVSVAGLIAIRKRFEPQPDASHEPVWASVRSGLRLMIADRVLRRDQLIWSLYSILGGSIVLGLVYVSTKGGRNDAALATVAVAAYAAGSAIGTLLAGKFEAVPSLWLAEAAGLGTAAAGAALLAVGGVPAIVAGGALFGLGEGLVLVFHLTLRARVTPDGYFGRITGVAGVGRPGNRVPQHGLARPGAAVRPRPDRVHRARRGRRCPRDGRRPRAQAASPASGGKARSRSKSSRCRTDPGSTRSARRFVTKGGEKVPGNGGAGGDPGSHRRRLAAHLPLLLGDHGRGQDLCLPRGPEPRGSAALVDGAAARRARSSRSRTAGSSARPRWARTAPAAVLTSRPRPSSWTRHIGSRAWGERSVST